MHRNKKEGCDVIDTRFIIKTVSEISIRWDKFESKYWLHTVQKYAATTQL